MVLGVPLKSPKSTDRSRNSVSSEFQTVRPATEKARWTNVIRQQRGTVSWCWLTEHRCRLLTAVTGMHWSLIVHRSRSWIYRNVMWQTHFLLSNAVQFASVNEPTRTVSAARSYWRRHLIHFIMLQLHCSHHSPVKTKFPNISRTFPRHFKWLFTEYRPQQQ